MLKEIQELYDYNRWANHRILDATAKLSQEQFTKDLRSSFPSIRDTLVHILSGEWIWLTRWKGNSPTGFPDTWDTLTREGLRKQWQEVERDQTAFLADLTEESLNRVIAYRNTAGQPFANPLWQMMRHVVNHSTYHRGQVTTMLRQLGAETVATDLILFFRERSKTAG
jgi:uncharacterized damage-inducible protein DinB